MTIPRFGRRPIPNRLPTPRPVPPASFGATDAELARFEDHATRLADRARWEAETVFYGFGPPAR